MVSKYLGMEYLDHMVHVCLNFLESGYTILYPHQQCMRILVPSRDRQHLILYVFLIVPIVVGVM